MGVPNRGGRSDERSETKRDRREEPKIEVKWQPDGALPLQSADRIEVQADLKRNSVRALSAQCAPAARPTLRTPPLSRAAIDNSRLETNSLVAMDPHSDSGTFLAWSDGQNLPSVAVEC